MTAPDIRYSDRLLLVGMTGTGKSTMARRLFLAAPPPRLVVDPADSNASDTPGAVTVTAPVGDQADGEPVTRAVMAALEARGREAPTLRYVPRVPHRLAEYEGVYRWAFRRFPRFVWLDEAGVAAPASGAAIAVRTLLVQGRKRQLGHMACHTRPREIDRNLIAQAQHVLVWQLPNPDDRKVIAQQMGLPVERLGAELAQLPQYGYLWFDQRAATVTAYPPLQL